MKRLRSDEGTLTGGTGDVNPQLLSFSAAQSGADTTTTTTQALPIQRLPTGGRSQVLEVLKVFAHVPVFGAVASATEAADSVSVFLSTSSFGTTAITYSEPRVFWASIRAMEGAFTAAGTYSRTENDIIETDLTDGAGHGLLIATDNIFCQVQSVGTGGTNTARIKLLYRWKNVGLREYVGLVQSQQ